MPMMIVSTAEDRLLAKVTAEGPGR
jgi:hypothetical protein